MTALYERRGRRYVPVASHQLHDVLRAGQFRLAYCYRDGMVRYAYDVQPDTAGFVAAAEVARAAMEEAMNSAAVARPSAPIPYTAKQLALLDEFRGRAASIGMLLPESWTITSARDISDAAIAAVRRYAP